MKRMAGLLLFAIFLLALTACETGGQTTPSEDRFCGFYLVLKGQDADDLDGVTGRYDPETETVRFESVEGYPCFYGASGVVDGKLDFLQAFCGDGVEMTKAAVNGNGGGEFSFTWHVAEDEERIVRPAFVYQKTDGSFYLRAESAMFGAGIGGFSDSRTWRENGEEQRVDCTLNIVVEKPLESVSFKEFDAGDQLTVSTVLTQERWQDELPFHRDTVWVLAEAEYADGTVTRTVYSRGEDQPRSFWFLKDDGIGIEKVIRFTE